ncbi:hypothetical protein [Providencia burhodogranariea]|uniref:Integrase catalytic subunit n=1 Tax=Providencia burhodogranariea DSM 19968 TaxID=1141662 RepID=K8WWH9_9GAMM|nr:hypothetical protein [Providencia burhodogranariea]EKT64938.1 integrase catalytic subunit [Providencia burhodogranariea DSM 19968]
MKPRKRIYYTPEQKVIIWDRYNHGDLSAFLSRFVTSRLPVIEIVLGLDQRIKIY